MCLSHPAVVVALLAGPQAPLFASHFLAALRLAQGASPFRCGHGCSDGCAAGERCFDFLPCAAARSPGGWGGTRSAAPGRGGMLAVAAEPPTLPPCLPPLVPRRRKLGDHVLYESEAWINIVQVGARASS